MSAELTSSSVGVGVRSSVPFAPDSSSPLMRVATLAGLTLVAALAMPGVAAAQTVDPCEGAVVREVATGLGSLENLEPDGTGGMLVSASSRDAIERVFPDGTTETVVADVTAPGGLRVREGGAALWFNTGDAAASGALGTADGTLERFAFATGTRTLITDGLVMPNGLVFDAADNAYVSRDIGLDASVTRIPAADRGAPEFGWAAIADSNGMAIDPTGTFLYVSSTFNAPASLFRVTLADPSEVEEIFQFVTVGTIPAKGLDDLTIDADGVLYLTANGSGELFRYDPATNEACVLTDALMNPSAVKFGAGPGWSPDALYVTGFDGRLVEVTLPVPPSSPEPVPSPTAAPVPQPSPTAPPAPQPTAAPTPAPAASPALPGPTLPVTGGGLGLAALAAAMLARRRPR